ncbi:MAG: hypothetical protein MJ188_01400 [Treponema sp.]|nr:hypothetical protein [Treponema sp.]
MNKKRSLFGAFILLFICVQAFAITSTQQKFLERASEAYEEEDINFAYKYITNALKLDSEDEDIVFYARVIYRAKLEKLVENYDPLAVIDIQTNLESFPQVVDINITKLLRQITLLEEKAEKDAQAEANLELIGKLDDGFKNLESGLSSNNESQKKTALIIAFSVIGIALLILIIVFMVAIFAKKGFQQQKEQQEHYMKAVQMLAASQNQTTRLMLGGITDLYNGGKGQVKIAGSSTWNPAALPDADYSEQDMEDLKDLAVKCEELGAKIDQVTGRKNNSKNVSELVYKLSIALGLTPGLSMLNFCAAMCYDAGFLSVDPEIMQLTVLTPEQKNILQEHVNLAEKQLSFVPKKYWSVFESAATKHHENMDGTGYPCGLKGEEIPQIARLIRVAETYVSMCSKRTYRQAMDKETAIAKLKEQPDYYDLTVVEVLEQIF